jgi:glycosyltransferase involved in cell wall biosynthesis
MMANINILENKQPGNLPLISVIIPAYNAEAFIGETLESVLVQTYRHIEILVIDDGSQDETANIVRSFAERDSRVCLIQQPNAGVVLSRNRGIQLAKGELIAPLDADDVWMPENLEKQVLCMIRSEPSVGVVYSWSFDIDEQSNPMGKFHAYTIEGSVYGTLLCHFFLSNASSSLIRKTCLEKVGLYRTQKDLPQGCEDWELYLRLAEFYQFKAVPQFLVGYRKHLNGMTNNTEVMAKFLSLIWEQTLKKYPYIPKFVYQISNSSFFLYLSWQGEILRQYQSSSFWWYQALKIGQIFSLINPVFYLILGKKTLRRLGLSKEENHSSNSLSMNQKQASTDHKLEPKNIPNEQWFSVRVQTLLGKLLHLFISANLSSPETWKSAS